MKRADREEETRQRITEAAVELHRNRGPANTGIVDFNTWRILSESGLAARMITRAFPR